MLSEAIRELRHRFGDYDTTGLTMSAEAVEAHIELFKFWEAEARALERRFEASGCDRASSSGATIVSFPRGRR